MSRTIFYISVIALSGEAEARKPSQEEAGKRRDVAGLMPLTEDMCQGSAKPVWLGSIAVDDVDQAVANIVEMGGSVQLPPTDIPNVGRLAMGPMGNYEFIRHNGVIGAIMPKPEDMPIPMWQYYFRCADIDTACNAITDKGGQILLGPHEIPGGDFMVKGSDPQGAMFALVGARK